MVPPPPTENPRFEGGENGDNDYPLVATSDGEAVSSPSPSTAASTPTAASAPTGGSYDWFVRRRLFVPDWVNHPTNCSFALGRTVSTGGDQYKLLRIRTDRVLQVCSVLALGGDGINNGSFARWRKVPSPPQNVFTGHRSVAVCEKKDEFSAIEEKGLPRAERGGQPESSTAAAAAAAAVAPSLVSRRDVSEKRNRTFCHFQEWVSA
uniref:Uncharacterized protein n=1 Tax=Oryza glumipatula TaxID=40148 RepID=A0A0E0AHJ7_9ORYZ